MSLVYYPAACFKQKAVSVTEFNDILLRNIDILQKTMQEHRAIGIGANMCGILQRIIIVPKNELIDDNQTIIMINPEIIEKSAQMQTYREASLSLPGIDAEITRPATIIVNYQDTEQQSHQITATGFLATVIQHEIDYLDGIVYLDYLPKGKAKLLREKMQKHIKNTERHGHNHSHQYQEHHHYHDGKLCTHKH